MTTTRIERTLRATPARVFHALTDADCVREWMVPDGMTGEVHEFDPRPGGRFRMTLTYDGDGAGKSTAHGDTHAGHFVALVPNRQVVQSTEFESDDPAMQGAMTIAFTLNEDGDGTVVEAVHDGVPPGVSPDDNAAGWAMAFDKLAALVERDAD